MPGMAKLTSRIIVHVYSILDNFFIIYPLASDRQQCGNPKTAIQNADIALTRARSCRGLPYLTFHQEKLAQTRSRLHIFCNYEALIAGLSNTAVWRKNHWEVFSPVQKGYDEHARVRTILDSRARKIRGKESIMEKALNKSITFIIVLVIAVGIGFCLMPRAAFADGYARTFAMTEKYFGKDSAASTSGDFKYWKHGSGVSIEYIGKAKSVTVPAKLNGKKVVAFKADYKTSPSAINTSKATELECIFVNDTSVKSLDVSKNSKLKILACWTNNKLSKITISRNKSLKYLECSGTIVSKLNVSGCPNLRGLWVNDTKIKKLNVSKSKKLQELDCRHCKLSKLVLGKNKKLKQLYCGSNNLKALNVKYCSNLEDLSCQNNKLTKLVLGKHKKLSDFSCGENKLTKINVSKCPALEYFDCHGNKLTKLSVAKNTKLIEFYCRENKLEKLVVGAKKQLETLCCEKNRLTAIDISGCSELDFFECYNNKLTKLVMRANKNLQQVDCSNNKLTSLNMSSCPNLDYLTCANNKLTRLYVAKNAALSSLYCSGNALTTLDVSKNASLDYLNCSNNKLTELLLAKEEYAFRKLDYSGNPLSAPTTPSSTSTQSLQAAAL